MKMITLTTKCLNANGYISNLLVLRVQMGLVVLAHILATQTQTQIPSIPHYLPSYVMKFSCVCVHRQLDRQTDGRDRKHYLDCSRGSL